MSVIGGVLAPSHKESGNTVELEKTLVENTEQQNRMNGKLGILSISNGNMYSLKDNSRTLSLKNTTLRLR